MRWATRAGVHIDRAACAVAHEDDEVLALTAPIFDAVHTYLRRSLLTGTDTP